MAPNYTDKLTRYERNILTNWVCLSYAMQAYMNNIGINHLITQRYADTRHPAAEVINKHDVNTQEVMNVVSDVMMLLPRMSLLAWQAQHFDNRFSLFKCLRQQHLTEEAG